ncbi:unnamed protein product [Sphagnum tenellum]
MGRSSLLLLLMLLFAFSGGSLATMCNASDRDALLALKAQIIDTQGQFNDWDPQTHCCIWTNCARNNSLIVKPKVNGSSFGASLSNLTALTQLTFVNVQIRFRFSIPHAIFTLTNLVNLLLTDCQFSGPIIPADVGKLVKLTELFLTGNRFPGGLPDSIGNLKNLNSLALENNQMTSIGSTRITLLKELDYVDLAHNKLSGPIPKWLGGITLTGAANGALNLMFNQFTGSFPGELCNIKPNYQLISYQQELHFIQDGLMIVNIKFVLSIGHLQSHYIYIDVYLAAIQLASYHQHAVSSSKEIIHQLVE